MAQQILVVDDDPIVGTLTTDLLNEAGYATAWVQDSMQAMREIKKEKPSLVILDILMPGIDGLTLLHSIKADPETTHIRAIVVSGKSFEAEKTRAIDYGADLFIEKPYDVETFGQKVAELMKIGGAVTTMPIGERTTQFKPLVEIGVTIWGCRSREQGPAAESRYGRNTSCVSIELPDRFFIFDAGSGIVPLGEQLKNGHKWHEAWLFLTHFHRDHVSGLEEFAPLNDANFSLHLAGASDADKPLDKAFGELFVPRFGDALPPCRLDLYRMLEHTYEIANGVRMTSFYANHPGTTLGFVLETEDRKIGYVPDSEIYGESATALQDYDEKLGGILRECDLLLHDGRYTEEDYKIHKNAGHSSFMSAVDFAGRNRIKQLVLVHQDAKYDDAALDGMSAAAQTLISARGYHLNVVVGRENLRLAI